MEIRKGGRAVKGLVCEICDLPEKGFFLCISEVREHGIVCIVGEDGSIASTNSNYLHIVKPQKIPPIFDDWRVQMGFESWNIYGD